MLSMAFISSRRALSSRFSRVSLPARRTTGWTLDLSPFAPTLFFLGDFFILPFSLIDFTARENCNKNKAVFDKRMGNGPGFALRGKSPFMIHIINQNWL